LTSGYVVTFQSQGIDNNGGSVGIGAQMYDENFVKVGGNFLLNSTTTFGQNTPSVAALANGGFVAVWVDDGRYTPQYQQNISGRIFTANGTPLR
jgi:hypothetical protein